MTITINEIRHDCEIGGACEYLGFIILLGDLEIGAASVVKSDDAPAYVERIDIDDAYRNHGYGSAALEQLSDVLGGVYIAPDSEGSKRLYARLGRQVSGVYYDEEYDDEMIMTSGDYADDVDQGYGVYAI